MKFLIQEVKKEKRNLKKELIKISRESNELENIKCKNNWMDK